MHEAGARAPPLPRAASMAASRPSPLLEAVVRRTVAAMERATSLDQMEDAVDALEDAAAAAGDKVLGARSTAAALGCVAQRVAPRCLVS